MTPSLGFSGTTIIFSLQFDGMSHDFSLEIDGDFNTILRICAQIGVRSGYYKGGCNPDGIAFFIGYTSKGIITFKGWAATRDQSQDGNN
jgi:hypothetical protein